VDNHLIEIKSDFQTQIEKVKEEILHIEGELIRKKEHFLRLQGGLETLSILEKKIINNED